jgi:hypothetical protein
MARIAIASNVSKRAKCQWCDRWTARVKLAYITIDDCTRLLCAPCTREVLVKHIRRE